LLQIQGRRFRRAAILNSGGVKLYATLVGVAPATHRGLREFNPIFDACGYLISKPIGLILWVREADTMPAHALQTAARG
jgi:hypothetical protein